MKDLTKQQKNFLENYAHTLNAVKSALDGGYSENVACVQAGSLLGKPKYQKALNAIIERNVDKFDIPKAFILKKYLQVIDYASGKCEVAQGFKKSEEVSRENLNEAKSIVGQQFSEIDGEQALEGFLRDFTPPRDAGLLLKALEGLQRFLARAEEEPKNDSLGTFWQIDNVDCNKI